VLSPANRGELVKLMTAHESRNADSLELGKLYLAAAREGVEFSLNTPADSAQLLQSIESAPVPIQSVISWFRSRAPREQARGVTYSR
jgi:hypothetical protein